MQTHTCSVKSRRITTVKSGNVEARLHDVYVKAHNYGRTTMPICHRWHSDSQATNGDCHHYDSMLPPAKCVSRRQNPKHCSTTRENAHCSAVVGNGPAHHTTRCPMGRRPIAELDVCIGPVMARTCHV